MQKHELNPSWKQFTIPQQKLCKNNEDNEIEIRIYNFSSRGNHTLIGTVLFTMKKLEQNKEYPIKNFEGKDQGTIRFVDFQRKTQHQFGDFL